MILVDGTVRHACQRGNPSPVIRFDPPTGRLYSTFHPVRPGRDRMSYTTKSIPRIAFAILLVGGMIQVQSLAQSQSNDTRGVDTSGLPYSAPAAGAARARAPVAGQATTDQATTGLTGSNSNQAGSNQAGSRQSEQAAVERANRMMTQMRQQIDAQITKQNADAQAHRAENEAKAAADGLAAARAQWATVAATAPSHPQVPVPAMDTAPDSSDVRQTLFFAVQNAGGRIADIGSRNMQIANAVIGSCASPDAHGVSYCTVVFGNTRRLVGLARSSPSALWHIVDVRDLGH